MALFTKKNSDVFAPVGGLQDIVTTDCRQITIALITNDNTVRVGPFQSGSHRRSAVVCDLDVASIEIVVEENTAAHRADHNGSVFHTEVFERFTDQLVQVAVFAARAIVGGDFVTAGFSLVDIIKGIRFYQEFFCHFDISFTWVFSK